MLDGVGDHNVNIMHLTQTPPNECHWQKGITERKKKENKCLQPQHVCAIAETLFHRDDALLYIAYVMLIWAAPIPADRWHCSLWP